MDADGVTPRGGADTVINKSAEDVLRRLPVRCPCRLAAVSGACRVGPAEGLPGPPRSGDGLALQASTGLDKRSYAAIPPRMFSQINHACGC